MTGRVGTAGGPAGLRPPTQSIRRRLLRALLLYAVLPLMLLWRVRVRPRRWTRAVGLRLATMGAALAVLVGTLMLVFQPFASMMRNHKEMRYLATPANYMLSLIHI